MDKGENRCQNRCRVEWNSLIRGKAISGTASCLASRMTTPQQQQPSVVLAVDVASIFLGFCLFSLLGAASFWRFLVRRIRILQLCALCCQTRNTNEDTGPHQKEDQTRRHRDGVRPSLSAAAVPPILLMDSSAFAAFRSCGIGDAPLH